MGQNIYLLMFKLIVGIYIPPMVAACGFQLSLTGFSYIRIINTKF